MNIDDLTIGEAREISRILHTNGAQAVSGTSLQIGGKYLIRTVTYHLIGKVVAITATDVVLEEASWLADSGRFGECLSSGKVNENEPIPGRHIVFRGSMIDAAEWKHETPVGLK